MDRDGWKSLFIANATYLNETFSDKFDFILFNIIIWVVLGHKT